MDIKITNVFKVLSRLKAVVRWCCRISMDKIDESPKSIARSMHKQCTILDFFLVADHVHLYKTGVHDFDR